MSLRLSRLAGVTAVLAVAALLTGCSSLGVGELPAAPAADAAQYGTGAIKVGMVTRNAADDLTEGAPDSTFLVAQMTTEVVGKSPTTLLVRRYDGTPVSLQAASDAFVKDGVRLVIAPADESAALTLASQLGRKGIPVISLGNASDVKVNLFAAGMPSGIEASLMADEMRRRRYRSVLLVSNPNGTARIFASQLATAIASNKIGVTPIDGSDPASASAQIGALVSGGQIPGAVVFLESAATAQTLMKRLRTIPLLAGTAAVGPSAWAFDAKAAAGTGPGWYLAPEGNSIATFSAKFAAAFKQGPMPEAALAYDLIVMAAALPQLFPGASPYSADVLLNDQGFAGVTGKFWLTPDGQTRRDLVPVEIAPALARPAT